MNLEPRTGIPENFSDESLILTRAQAQVREPRSCPETFLGMVVLGS